MTEVRVHLECGMPVDVLEDHWPGGVRFYCPPCDRFLPTSHTIMAVPVLGAVHNPVHALDRATAVGAKSPCQKSKRGVVIFHPTMGLLAEGFNHPPPGFACDGSAACREHCNKLCVHAESDALSRLPKDPPPEAELLHVKVVDGQAFAGGPPSCWQCSREILNYGISQVWLFQDTRHLGELVQYTADQFHRITLANCGITPIFAPHDGIPEP